MKPLKEFYPDGLNEDYNPLFESMGFEIIFKEDDENYTGNSYVLFHDTVKSYGWLIFVWDSCSRCDDLQTCESLDDAESLRLQLYNSIRWGTASELLHYFQTHDWESNWYGDRETREKFLQKCIEFLQAKA